MLQASLLTAMGKSKEAKEIYQNLTSINMNAQNGKVNALGGFDSNVASEAKDQLLLLELGVL